MPHCILVPPFSDGSVRRSCLRRHLFTSKQLQYPCGDFIGHGLLGNEELDGAPVARRGNVPTSPKLDGAVERVLGAVRNQRSGPGGRRERPPLGRRRSRRITRFGQSAAHRALSTLFRGQRDAFMVQIESRAHLWSRADFSTIRECARGGDAISPRTAPPSSFGVGPATLTLEGP